MPGPCLHNTQARSANRTRLRFQTAPWEPSTLPLSNNLRRVGSCIRVYPDHQTSRSSILRRLARLCPLPPANGHLSKAVSQPGFTSVSLFRKTRYLPRAVFAPVLQEAMKPELLSLRRYTTPDIC